MKSIWGKHEVDFVYIILFLAGILLVGLAVIKIVRLWI